MGKGTKNRATAERTASEKDAVKSPRVFSLAFPIRAFPHYLNAWNRLKGRYICSQFRDSFIELFVKLLWILSLTEPKTSVVTFSDGILTSEPAE